jgi:hypothetical protein
VRLELSVHSIYVKLPSSNGLPLREFTVIIQRVELQPSSNTILFLEFSKNLVRLGLAVCAEAQPSSNRLLCWDFARVPSTFIYVELRPLIKSLPCWEFTWGITSNGVCQPSSDVLPCWEFSKNLVRLELAVHSIYVELAVMVFLPRVI